MPHHEDKRMYEERKYESEAFWSSIGTATVFTIVGIISIILAVLDNPFIGLAYWGYWLFVPAFFIYIGAISTYFKNHRLKSQVLAAIMNYHGKKVILENLAAEVMMKPKNLMRILIDLRTEFKIKFRYDTQSGELIIGEEVEAVSSTSTQPAATSGTKFCRGCGRRVEKEDSAFCTFCGSQL